MKSKKQNVTPAEELQKLQVEIKTFEDNWKRALADYQNLVKRVESDKKDLIIG